MASYLLRSRVPILAALVFVAGCPATCQRRRDTRIDTGQQVAVSVGKAEVEKQKQTIAAKGMRTTKRLRPDGTPWEIVEEKDDTTTVLEIDRELLAKAEVASLTWDRSRETETTDPWWRMPVLVLCSAVAGAGIALLLIWRFRSGWPFRR